MAPQRRAARAVLHGAGTAPAEQPPADVDGGVPPGTVRGPVLPDRGRLRRTVLRGIQPPGPSAMTEGTDEWGASHGIRTRGDSAGQRLSGECGQDLPLHL